jgi:hypothetical protein
MLILQPPPSCPATNSFSPPSQLSDWTTRAHVAGYFTEWPAWNGEKGLRNTNRAGSCISRADFVTNEAAPT